MILLIDLIPASAMDHTLISLMTWPMKQPMKQSYDQA